MALDYTWRIDTSLSREEVAKLLEPFRPFRLEVSFSNGFSTAEFADKTPYQTREPLAKLHYFADHVSIGPATRILDIGSHFGHYGHHFLKAGAGAYTGIELDRRAHEASAVLAQIAGIDARLLRTDIGGIAADSLLRSLGTFDVIICLSVLNNVANWLLALDRIASLAGGTVVLEYAAIDSDRAICEFSPQGHGPDVSHHWWFSEPLVDELLIARGLEKVATTLRWRNDQALGVGRLKIFSIYRLVVAGGEARADIKSIRSQ